MIHERAKNDLQRLIDANEQLGKRVDYLIRRWEGEGHPGDAKEITDLCHEMRHNMALIRDQSEELALQGVSV
jgi:hypothetical protein